MEVDERARQVNEGYEEQDQQGQRQEPEQGQQQVELVEECCDGQLPSRAVAGPSEKQDCELLTFRSVGVCYSVFGNKRGVPRQGQLAPSK
jgi:hypothetical protein